MRAELLKFKGVVAWFSIASGIQKSKTLAKSIREYIHCEPHAPNAVVIVCVRTLND